MEWWNGLNPKDVKDAMECVKLFRDLINWSSLIDWIKKRFRREPQLPPEPPRRPPATAGVTKWLRR